MISGKLRKEYDRIENANSIFNNKLNKNRNLNYLCLLLFASFYTLFAFTLFDNPLNNNLNILFGSYKQIVDFIFMFLSFIFFGGWVYMRNLEKKIRKNFALSNDEDIFYNNYDLLNEINRYNLETNERRKDTIMSTLLNKMRIIVTLINNWDYGNIKYIKSKYGLNVELFKENINKLEYNVIKKGDKNILNNLKIFLVTLNEYLFEPYDNGIKNLNFLISNLPLENGKVMVSYGITDYLYNQPNLYSILFSMFFATFFLVIAKNYNLGVQAMILISLTSFGISFNVLHTILKKEKNEIIKEEKEEVIGTMLSVYKKEPVIKEIAKKFDEKILFEEDFENYSVNSTLASIISPWEIIGEKENIIVTDEIKGSNGTNQCCKIIHHANEKTFMILKFKESQKLLIEYFIRQESYKNNGIGTGLHIFHTPIDRNNPINKQEAIWINIHNKYLSYYDGGVKALCEIKLKKWYKIELYIDCLNQKYEIKVNDKQAEGRFRHKHEKVNAIITDHWVDQQDWVTYIDEIKITKLD